MAGPGCEVEWTSYRPEGTIKDGAEGAAEKVTVKKRVVKKTQKSDQKKTNSIGVRKRSN